MEADQFKYTRYPNAHYVSPMYYKGAYNCKFTFYYNMWHYKQALFTDVQLNVLYRRGGRDTKLWSRQATTFNKWNKAVVQLPKCPQDFRVSLTRCFSFQTLFSYFQQYLSYNKSSTIQNKKIMKK